MSGLLTSWDGGWYRFIADSGYPASGHGDLHRFAFFPGYPSLIRAFDWVLPGGSAVAALVASLLTGALATVAVWLLARDRFDVGVANTAAWLFVFFPTSAVLSMAYSEGLLIAASALALWAIERRWWLWAGLASSVAGFTRLNGAVVVGICVVAAAIELTRRWSWRPVVAMVVAPAGFVGFVIMVHGRTGDWLAFAHAQSLWGQSFDGFGTLFRSIRDLMTTSAAWRSAVPVMAAAAVVYLLVGLVMMWRQRPLPWHWWVFTLCTGVLALTPSMPISSLRYSFAAFPVLIAVAPELRTRNRLTVVVAVSAVLLGALTTGWFIGSVQAGSGMAAYQP